LALDKLLNVLSLRWINNTFNALKWELFLLSKSHAMIKLLKIKNLLNQKTVKKQSIEKIMTVTPDTK